MQMLSIIFEFFLLPWPMLFGILMVSGVEDSKSHGVSRIGDLKPNHSVVAHLKTPFFLS